MLLSRQWIYHQFTIYVDGSFTTTDWTAILDQCPWWSALHIWTTPKTYFQWVLLFLFLPLKMSRYHGYQLYNFFFFKYIKWSWWKRVLWNSFLTPWSWISYFRNKMKRYICIHSETEPQRQLLRCDNLPPFKIVNSTWSSKFKIFQNSIVYYSTIPTIQNTYFY